MWEFEKTSIPEGADEKAELAKSLAKHNVSLLTYTKSFPSKYVMYRDLILKQMSTCI